MNRIILTGLLCAALVAPARAQNAMFAETEIVHSISAAEMIAVLTGLGLQARFVEEDAENTKHIEAAAEGATVYIALRACDGAGTDARCTTVQPYGFFDASGVTLNQTNDYNLGRSAIATAGLAENNVGVVGAKIYLVHGVTAENFGFELALFFLDVDELFAAIKPGVVARVAWREAPAEASDWATRPELFVNRVGVGAPLMSTPAMRELLEGRSKIKAATRR